MAQSEVLFITAVDRTRSELDEDMCVARADRERKMISDAQLSSL
jgi:hypothetical protein